jgi:hypothetical protein
MLAALANQVTEIRNAHPHGRTEAAQFKNAAKVSYSPPSSPSRKCQLEAISDPDIGNETIL